MEPPVVGGMEIPVGGIIIQGKKGFPGGHKRDWRRHNFLLTALINGPALPEFKKKEIEKKEKTM
jgi:hypothetical protein